MTPKEFLDNEKKVLHAAYMFSGIDPSKHVSAENCLRKDQRREEPFRLPLKAKVKTFAAKTIMGNPTTNSELSFIPVALQSPRDGS